MKKFVGVDLGGTLLKAAIVDVDSGEISGLEKIDTLARQGHDAVIERMAGLIDEVIRKSGIPKSQIGGVGIGVPGVLDLDKGLVLFLPNLPGTWPNVPLRQRIEASVGLPTQLLNDVRSMTLGEWTFGAGRGVDTIACFAIGTGVGGGLVINGKLHLGIGGTGGELGHQSIDMNGPVCGCGSRGCLEVYASGPAITTMGIKAVVQGLTTKIGEVVGYDLNKITPKTIYQAAMQGDEVARKIYEEAGFYIGVAVSNTLAAIGPRKVVIGGGVAQAGDLLLEPIRKTVKERVHIMPVDQVEIVLAELGPNAGLIGAALWASACKED
ncbi:MAG: ROK family protein [Anaerolineales bacterium]|nr:ROK family protein [Anaerolineales bacterium]